VAVDGSHSLDDVLGEQARLSRDTDEHGWIERLDGAQEIRKRGAIVGVRQIVLTEMIAAFDDQAVDIDEPASTLSRFLGETLLLHRGHHEIGDAGARGPRAEKQDGLIDQAPLGDPPAGEHPGERHRRRPLLHARAGGGMGPAGHAFAF